MIQDADYTAPDVNIRRPAVAVVVWKQMGMRNTFNYYDGFTYPTIDTTTLSPEQVSKKLLRSFSDELFLPRESQTSEMLF